MPCCSRSATARGSRSPRSPGSGGKRGVHGEAELEIQSTKTGHNRLDRISMAEPENRDCSIPAATRIGLRLFGRVAAATPTVESLRFPLRGDILRAARGSSHRPGPHRPVVAVLFRPVILRGKCYSRRFDLSVTDTHQDASSLPPCPSAPKMPRGIGRGKSDNASGYELR